MKKAPFLFRAANAWETLLGRKTRSIYSGATFDRTTLDWIASCLPPDQEIRGDLRTLRARWRQLERDNPFAMAYLDLLAVNVIGPDGIGLQAQFRDRLGDLDTDLNRQVEGAWTQWANGPVTADGLMNLWELSNLALPSTARDGEFPIRELRGFDNASGYALQPIDPDLIDETMSSAPSTNRNEVRLGIEVDQRGAPVRYWVRDFIGYASLASNRFYSIPASEMIFLCRPRRANQARCVSWFHPVIGQLHMLQAYIESELMNSRVASSACGVWEDIDPKEPGVDAAPVDGSMPTMEAQSAMFLNAPSGKKLSVFAPNHPTQQFPDFIKAIIRQLAAGLNVSYHSIAQDLESTSFSSARIGVQAERDNYRRLQTWWISKFQQRVFNSWLPQAVLRGVVSPDALPGPGRMAPVQWIPRTWSSVDPLNDNQADVLALQWRLTSPQRLLRERGGDLEQILEEIEAAQILSKQYGVRLTPNPPATPAASPDGSVPPDATSTNGKSNGTAQPANGKPARAPKSRIGV